LLEILVFVVWVPIRAVEEQTRPKMAILVTPYIVYPGSLKNLESKKYSQKSKMVKSEVGSGLFGP